MARERWFEIDDSGQAFLIKELDGWAYLRAVQRGEPRQWRTPVTITSIETDTPWPHVRYRAERESGSILVSLNEARSLIDPCNLEHG